MKKTGILLMLTVLTLTLLLVLAGCSSGKTTTPASTTPATTSPTASLPAAQPAISASIPAATTTKPSVPAATTPPPVQPTTQPASTQVSSGMDKALKALMDKSLSINSMKFDLVMSGGLMTAKAYQKKNKTRMDTSMMGMNMIMLTDDDKKITYTYLPAQNKATMTDLNKQSAAPSQADIQDIWGSNLVLKGTETLAGKTCTVAEYSQDTPQGKATGKVWIWQDYGVPLRMDTSIGGMTITIEFKNYEFVDVADDLFELPPGVEMVEKLDLLPSGLPSGLPASPPGK